MNHLGAALLFLLSFTSSLLTPLRGESADERVTSPLPAPGIHPRLFFSPQDVPAIKERVLQSDSGAALQRMADERYQTMKSSLQEIAALDNTQPTADLVDKFFRDDETRNNNWGIIAYDAFIRDDLERERLMAEVVAGYSRLILASKEMATGGRIKGGTGNDFGSARSVWANHDFNVGTSWLFGAAGLPVCYDLLFNVMTPDQRDVVRHALATATKDRVPFGAGAPVGRAFSNWYGYGGELAVMTAAIEGEEGYDAATYQRITSVLQNYFKVSYTDAGASHEDTYGPNLGLRAGSWALLVMARRGEDLFATPKYHNFIRYYAEELQPFPGGTMVGGASGNSITYLTSAIIAHYQLPTNPVANYIYRYILKNSYTKALPGQDSLAFALFGTDWNEPKATFPTLENLGLPLTIFYPERGKLITRSDWTINALDVHFDARPDAFAIGHDTPERGEFYINALGRAWSKTYFFRDTSNSSDFPLIQIDGRAEAWKAPSGKFVTHNANEAGASAVADLKYAYDWQWTPPWPSKDQKFPAPWEPEMSDPRTLGWPGNEDYIPHKLYGEEGIGHIGSYLWKRPYNPVLMNFRSVVLVRGPHPYVLITDDIQKDNSEHLYDWHFQLQTDLVTNGTPGKETVLADPNSDRRLLVAALQADGFTGSKMDSYTVSTTKKGQPVPGLRYILSANTVTPHFKFLLYPFTEGENRPKVTFDSNSHTAKINWSEDQSLTSSQLGLDTITYRVAADGHSVVTVNRAGQELISTD